MNLRKPKRGKRNSNGGGVYVRSTTIQRWENMVFVNDRLIKKTYSVQKEKKIKKDLLQAVYDPRVDDTVHSDNPALIIAEIMTKRNFVRETNDFWNSIKILADYCDQRI